MTNGATYVSSGALIAQDPEAKAPYPSFTAKS